MPVCADVTSEINQENTMPVDDGANAKSKRSKHVLRKAVDTDFCYVCEWCDCKHESYSMNEFNHHVSLHRRAYTQHLGPEAEQGEEEFIFYCQWRDCHSQIEGKVEDFTRHVHYHTFHQFLKYLGRHVQKVDGMGDCGLGNLTRNMIPELPEKLMCRWQDCNMVYDNPYIFYSHVAHHCEDIPKDKNSVEPIACKWEGCKAVLKSWYKIREHMRSHTQAKVVACPTCGSLFANNTRFIDHLMRQLQTGPSFSCSNCGAKFASERLLRDHMRRHVNHYKCPLCDMTCPSPSGVRDHVRYRHSDERSYQCPNCDYRAKTASDLRVHVLCGSHGNRPRAKRKKTAPSEEISDDEDDWSEEEAESDSGITQRVAKKIQSVEKEAVEQKSVPRNYKIRHRGLGLQQNEPRFQCHLCQRDYNRGSNLSKHLKEVHKYTLPSGHKRFRYSLHNDNFWRLQTVRLESKEVSEQLLGQEITSPQDSDDEDDDSDDDQRLMIDETTKRGMNARIGPRKGSKPTPRKKGSESRRSPRKGNLGHDSSNHALHQLIEDNNTRDNKAGDGRMAETIEDEEETAAESSRKNPGRRCKRKRSESEERVTENSSDMQRAPKKRREVSEGTYGESCIRERLSPSKCVPETSSPKSISERLSPCKVVLERLSPSEIVPESSSLSKTVKGEANTTHKSLISLAAVAAGLDTLENNTESQGQNFSMPSMEDFTSVTTESNSGTEYESQTEKHTPPPGIGFYTEGGNSKASSIFSDKNIKSGRPVRKGRALPSRFSAKRPCFIQEPPSPITAPFFNVSSARRASHRIGKDKDRDRGSERIDNSPAAASTVSSSSAWMPPSVEGVESVTDEGDAASVGATPHYGTDTEASTGATPHYGTDTDFSEFNPDSPGSSTSVYAINPQYIQQLKQRLRQQEPQEQQEQNKEQQRQSEQQQQLREDEQHPQEEQQPEGDLQYHPQKMNTSMPSSQESQNLHTEDSKSLAIPSTSIQLSENSGTSSNHMTANTSYTTSSVVSESSTSSTPNILNVPQQSALAVHPHHREDTNDSWFALLTQAELCREEQQKKQHFLGSPTKFAEVIVGSGSQLSSLAKAGNACVLRHSMVDNAQSQNYHVSNSNYLNNQQEFCSTTASTSTSNFLTTLITESPQKTVVHPLSPPHKPSITSLLSPPSSMFPSPEKSFFTIGWALGAGVSPIKQEFEVQASSEELSRSSVDAGSSRERGSIVGEVELKCEEDAGLDFASKDDSRITHDIPSFNRNNSNKDTTVAVSSLLVSGENPDGPKEDKQLETLQALSSAVNSKATTISVNDEVSGSTESTVITNAEGSSVIVVNDTNVRMCGDAVEPAAVPQELYQVVKGPDGEYQIVGLTSADLYNLVDSEGRSVVFPQQLDGVNPNTEQSVTSLDHSSIVVTVDNSVGWVVPAVPCTKDEDFSHSGMNICFQEAGQDIGKNSSNSVTDFNVSSGDLGSNNLQDNNIRYYEQTSDQNSIMIKNETEGNNLPEDSKQHIKLDVAEILSESHESCSVNCLNAKGLIDADTEKVVKEFHKNLRENSTNGIHSCSENNEEYSTTVLHDSLKAHCSVIKSMDKDSNISHENRQRRVLEEGNAEVCDDENVNNSCVADNGGDGNSEEVEDKDKGGLYNLQMLGEVALNSEAPSGVDVTAEES